jgi:hypothetical protein
MRRIGIALLGGLLAGPLAAPAMAATYYVDPNGNDLSSGSFENPWETLGKANQTLVAGDTVFIRGGTYLERIRPDRSGSEGNPIVFSRYQDEEPKITDVTDCVLLSQRSYITIDGITCDGENVGPASTVRSGAFMANGSYNVIQNSTFRFIERIGIGLTGGSHHNELRNNVLHHIGNDVDGIGEAIDVAAANNNLIEGNSGSFAGHDIVRLRDGSSYNVFRGNEFTNAWWRIVGFIGESSVYNVFEENRVFDADVTPNFTCCFPPSAFKIWSPHSIIRRNLFYDNGLLGLKAAAQNTPGATRVDHNKIYHNVFYRNGKAGWANLDDGSPAVATDSNQFVNNILLENSSRNPGHIQIDFSLASRNEDPPDPLNDNLFRSNVILAEAPDKFVISVNGMPQSTLTGYQDFLAPDHFTGNIEDDPGFIDAPNADFQLGHKNSPCVFSDGFDLVAGDRIQLEGQTLRATICQVNYVTNTLTVNTELSWNAGDGLALAYEDAAPDMGAFEFGAPDEPPIFCGPPTVLGPCEDGVDNDGDGDIDLADAGCKHAGWHTEDPQCNDGVDNDGDGLIDLADGGCLNRPYRDSETSGGGGGGGGGCGLGFELALVLALLVGLDRKRWRAA